MALQDAGHHPIAEASMSKVYVTELLQRLALAGVDMLEADDGQKDRVAEGDRVKAGQCVSCGQ